MKKLSTKNMKQIKYNLPMPIWQAAANKHDNPLGQQMNKAWLYTHKQSITSQT